MGNIKKFEDFLDKMRGLLDNAKKQGHIIVRVEDIENTFPELKESEDERIRKALLRFHKSTIDIDGIKGGDILAWLEKQGEQKSAWSEEDALRLEEAIYMIKARGWIRGDDAVKLVLDWLKSLKDRYTWKPSSIQMECLHDAINHYYTNGYPASKLKELYEQMSKIYKL